MANVLNRTSKEYRTSVHTPSYSETDWIVNPDLTAVGEWPSRYWKIAGDTVVLQTEEERTATDAAMGSPSPSFDPPKVTTVELTASTSTTSTTWEMLLSTTIAPRAETTSLKIDFSSSTKMSRVKNLLFQIMVNGLPAGSASGQAAAPNATVSVSLAKSIRVIPPTEIVITIRWRVGGGVATIDPTQDQDTSSSLEHATLLVEEIAD